MSSTVTLLQPYKDTYLQQATRVRDTIAFSYSAWRGIAARFPERASRTTDVQLNYVNLVAAYLNAANQLNLAVGREVIQ